MKEQNTDRIPGLAPGIEMLAELRPYVRHCGAARRPAWRIGARKLLDYLIVYIAEGTGEFTIDGVRYDAHPNDLFWIPPDTIHIMEGYPPSMVCPYAHFDLVYRPPISHWDFSIPEGMTDLSELLPLMHPDMSHLPLGRLCGKLNAHTNARVGGLIKEISTEAARAHPFAGLRMAGLLMEAFAEILRGKESVPAEYESHVPQLEAAAALLRDRLAEQGLSVEEAADAAGLSPSYFRKLFQLLFGCSPRHYLRNARIQKAKRLMIASSQSVTEIARACGFATVHSFSRAFRTVERVTPTQFRTCGEPYVRVSSRATPYSR